jgi:hypothetical protein
MIHDKPLSLVLMWFSPRRSEIAIRGGEWREWVCGGRGRFSANRGKLTTAAMMPFSSGIFRLCDKSN